MLNPLFANRRNMETRSKKRVRPPSRLPDHVTCGHGLQCLFRVGKPESTRAKQKNTKKAIKDGVGFLKCGHWCCTEVYDGQQISCCELHQQEGCAAPGHYDLKELTAIYEEEKQEMVSLLLRSVVSS